MGVIIPEGYAQIVMRWGSINFASGGGATVLGFGGEGTPVQTPEAQAVDVAQAWDNHLRILLDSNYQLVSVYWATATESGEWAVGEFGGYNVKTPPPNVALLNSYKTAAKGPRGRGRSYWPGMVSAEAVGENGIVEAGAFSEINDAFNDFWDELDAVLPDNTPNQVILQRDEPEQKTPPLSLPPTVTSRVLQNRVASQRRRLRR